MKMEGATVRAIGGMLLRVTRVMRVMRIVVALSLVSLVWAATAGRVEANGVPVTINLTYLDGVSNWGPTDATGTSVVVLREEEVELSVAGLPKLSGEMYEVWLANTAGGDWLSVGKFNVDGTGAGELQESIDLPSGLPEHPYDLLLITVEPEPDSSAAPTDKVSIAGYFPGTHGAPASTATATTGPGSNQDGAEATASATAVGPTARGTSTPAVVIPNKVRTPSVTGTPGLSPSRLPKTGEPAAGGWAVVLGVTLLVIGGATRAVVANRKHE
jgi:LPXTG-motif cell wall-anchored protein